MQRFDSIDYPQNAIDQSLASIVVQLAQRFPAAEVISLIRVTSGAFQWAFAGDLNRKSRGITFEDLAPRSNDVMCVHRRCVFSGRLLTLRPLGFFAPPEIYRLGG